MLQKYFKSSILLCLIFVFFAGTTFAAPATDNTAILQELKALRAELAEMDAIKKRLAELESIVANQPQAAKTADVSATEQESISTIKEIVAEVIDEKRPIKVGGAVRVNYGSKDWDDTHDEKYGDFGFETFRLNVDGEINDWILSAEYRMYSYMHTIHHGYIGYNVNDKWQVQVGIHQVPFGLQPYASHNFWFSGAYYVGLEDDYDAGIKALYNDGPLSLALAFYKNGELASSSNADRYSIDVNSAATGGYAGAQADGNEETNQFNARLAYDIDHGDLGNTEFGVSGQWGQLYNTITDDTGDQWAAGVHMNGNYGNWNVQLEYLAYEYDPENPLGVDDDIITLGGFGCSWGAPAEADLGIANVSYTITTDNLKWLDSVTLYSDNTIIHSSASNQPTSWQNVIGAMFATGPVYTYVDIISAENMIFAGGNMVDKTVANNDERTTRLNLNIGYYW